MSHLIDNNMLSKLNQNLTNLIKVQPFFLSGNKKLVTTKSGIYMFSSMDDSVCYYVGRAGNIRGRVFNGHLSMSKRKVTDINGIKLETNYYTKAPLKNALLGWAKAKSFMNINPEAKSELEADEIISQKLNFRFLMIPDILERGLSEYYITSVLNAKYAIDKEH